MNVIGFKKDEMRNEWQGHRSKNREKECFSLLIGIMCKILVRFRIRRTHSIWENI